MKSCPWSVFRALPAIVVAAALVGAGAARGEDLDARKTGPQLFEQTCSTCHRSPAGLAKGQGASGLVDFLRQHYTTGPGQAGQLAAYLLANPGDGRRARPAVNPSGPDDIPEQSSTRRRPAQNAEPAEPSQSTRQGTRASRRHQAEQPAGTEPAGERQAAPAAEQTGGHRGRNQRAARHPEPPPADRATPEGQPAAARTGTGNRRQPPPTEPKPQSPVAAEAATPGNPQQQPEAAAPAPTTEAPATPSAPATPAAPARADDQPAFSAPTP